MFTTQPMTEWGLADLLAYAQRHDRRARVAAAMAGTLVRPPVEDEGDINWELLRTRLITGFVGWLIQQPEDVVADLERAMGIA